MHVSIVPSREPSGKLRVGSYLLDLEVQQRVIRERLRPIIHLGAGRLVNPDTDGDADPAELLEGEMIICHHVVEVARTVC